MKNAVASNWVAETCVAEGSGFTLKGTSKGYTSFSDAFSAGDQVFYSAHDDQGNREAGYATFDGVGLVDREPTATLVNGVYSKSSVTGVSFSGEITIACTFNAVAFNVLWKALDAIDPDGDGSINIPPELIDGLIDKLDTKAEQADLEQEIQDRIDGDQALQDQIDALDPDGDLNIDWDEIQNKPTEFPPEAHNQGWDTITGKPADYPPSAHNHAWSEITGKPSEFPPENHGHEIADVNGLQDALDSAGGTPAWDDVTGKPTEFPPAAHTQDWSTITNTPSEYPPSAHGHAWDDVTGKPTEFPPEAHTHEQSEVDGLEDRLTQIEGSISSGGGFVDAPNDGQLYGRQSEAWAVVPDGGASSWNDLTDKPSEFPPAAHNHDGVYQPVGDYIGDAPNDGEEYARKNQGWVKLQDHNYTGADAVKLTGDQSAAGHKTWTGVATFGDTVTMRGILNGDVSANFGGPVTATSFVKSGGTSDQYLMADGSVHTDPALIGSNLDGMWELSDSGPAEGQMTARNANWLSITEITVHNTDANGYTHNFALMAEGDLVVIQTMVGGAEYLVSSKVPDGLTCKFTLDTVSSYGTFPSVGDNVKVDFIPQAAQGPSLIKPGDDVGQVATWSGTEWTPESRLKLGAWGMSLTGDQYITATNPDSSGGFTQWTNTSGSMSIGMAGEVVNQLLIYDRKEANVAATYEGGASGSWNFWTNNQNRLTIDASGIATFAEDVCTSRIRSAVPDRAGFVFGNGASILPVDGTGSDTTGVASLGRDDQKYKDGWFAGTVNANKFVGDGSGLTNLPGGGGGLPNGDFTHNGVITATDFIATSDERAKDNITTAPVGLIDSLKGREWEWKESGEKGSGVVAQELEEVLPHLVHEDEDGMKAVAYNGLIAYLIEELKDCRQRIAELEAKS